MLQFVMPRSQPRSFVAALAAACMLAATACTNVTTRSGEGQYCSTSDDENPNYQCDPSRGLSCVATHSVSNTSGATETTRPVFLCRFPCMPGGAGCPLGDDVCCPGKAPGNKDVFACVPSQFCAAIPSEDPDASVPVVRNDGGADARDAAADAPAPQDGAPADANATPDAGADASGDV